jgi:hypothetical protein
MRQSYFHLSVCIEKSGEFESEIRKKYSDYDPPMSITIGHRYIIIDTYHQKNRYAKEAEANARRRWEAGTFSEVLSAIAAEITSCKANTKTGEQIKERLL